MLLCNHLTIGYGAKVIQRDLTFSLRSGELVCMLGRNGCGKSTLLRTLAGLQPPLDGTFQLGNSNHQSREVALVLSSDEAIESTTVHDVVAMGRYPYTSLLGKLSPADEQIIEDALAAVGFEFRKSPFKTLSNSPLKGENSSLPLREGQGGSKSPFKGDLEGLFDSPFMAHSDGEKQRILIAKALAQQTPIILLDEPTAHLDLPNRIRVLQLLRSLAHNEGKTILISTHELDLATRLSDRILLMTPQQGIQLATPEELIATDAFTQSFGINPFDFSVEEKEKSTRNKV